MPQSINLVIFDLGRVMIRLCDGWRHACDRAGVPFRDEFDQPHIRQRLVEIMYRHEIGQIDDNTWAGETASVTGIAPAQALAISHQWLDGPFPGWHELLDRIGETSVRTACLSNTNALHWRLMTAPTGPNRLPLDRLHFQFASHLIGAHKPDPVIYRHVEKTTGIPPQSILFFDDVAANVEGARACGWAAHAIDIHADPVTQITRVLHDHRLLTA